MEFSKDGALEMGRKSFVSTCLNLKPIKEMGEGGEKYLNEIYDAFERADRENRTDKLTEPVSRVRKRKP